MSELPAGWTEASIFDVAELKDSIRVPLNGRQRSEMPGEYPYYGANGLVDHVGDYLFDGEHVLLAEDGGYFDDPRRGVAYKVGGRFWVNNHAHILEAIGGIPTEFLERWLNAVNWMPFVSGTTRLKLTQAGMRRVSLPLPPLTEQRRIVAKLDRLSARTKAARAHLTRVQSLATRAKQATLAAAFRGELTADWRKRSDIAFPWETQEIGVVAKIVTGNTPPTKEAANYGDSYPFAKPGDLDKGEIAETESALSEKGFQLARQLPMGTVLVSCIGSLGKIGILARKGSCNQQINAILPAEGIAPRFTFYWAHTLKEWLEANSSATTVAIINKGRFSKASFPIVDVDEQNEIVRRIEATFARIDRMVEEATRAAHLLDRLDQRLLAKAFRGELVPQDPNDEHAADLLARIKAARAAAPKSKRGRRQRA